MGKKTLQFDQRMWKGNTVCKAFSQLYSRNYGDVLFPKCAAEGKTRKHSSRMRTDRAVTRMSSERIAKRPIVDRQTPVKTLPSPCGR